jgi:hypothetical protein
LTCGRPAARRGIGALLARLHGLAAHRRRGLARLRHQAALLFLKLLEPALRHPDEVAFLRFGLRGQRRGGALGIVVAAAIEIGLRQHGRLRGFTADFELTSTTSSCGSDA